MAAVLCKGIGDLIGGLCHCLGTIITFPCVLCGETCTALSELCQKSPFSVQVAVTVLLQGPAMVIALLGILDGSTTCSGGGSSSDGTALIWLGLAIVFGIIHIAAAVYLAVRVANRNDPELEHMNSALRRANHLLCQDHWIAVYIMIGLIGYVVFLGMGSNWLWSGAFDVDSSSNNNNDGGDDDCTSAANDSMQEKIQLVVGLGWFFLIFGGMALCTSLCCAVCDNEDYGGTGETNNSNMNNDVESPNGPRPPPPTSPYATSTNSGTSSGKQKPPASYTAGGEPEIPVAYAEPVPSSPYASAPPAEEDEAAYAKASAQYNAAHKQQDQQQDQPQPNSSSTAKASSWGMTMGQQVGKLLYKNDEQKQQELKNKGKQTGEAVGKGFLSAKTFVQSKLNQKPGDSKNSNNNSSPGQQKTG